MTVTTLGGWNNIALNRVVPVRGAPQMMKSFSPGALKG
jgi:hypothetical protein